jgi:uncharacterized protein
MILTVQPLWATGFVILITVTVARTINEIFFDIDKLLLFQNNKRKLTRQFKIIDIVLYNHFSCCTMNKQIFINLITKDLAKSTSFYTALGFTKNLMFSDENASAMMWGENIFFMLLSEPFARHFDDNKEFVDQKKTVSAYYALTCESKEEVDEICAKATSAGGRVYTNKYNQEVAGDFMYSFEIEDTDGYIFKVSCSLI